VRVQNRLWVLGALLGLGLLVVAIGVVESSAFFSSATEPPPRVKVVTSAPSGTVPPTVPGSGADAPSILESGGGVDIASSTSAPRTTAAPTTTVAELAPLAFDGFDRSLASRLIGHGALAVSVAVAKNGELIHEAAFGVANQTTGEAASPAHRFRIGSNSKVLTATVVMELVQDGVLHLDDAVLGRLAEKLGVAIADPAIGTITLRQLLSHTSGFPEYGHTFFGGGVASCPDAARKALTGHLLAPPGTLYRYSNMNFCVLGLVIEQATGQPYESVVQARLLRPLGIDDMRMAGTYDVRPGEVLHPTTPGRNFMETLGGAGAWLGTADDLVRIIDALDRTRPGWHPLSQAMLDQMLAPRPGVGYSPGQWYGLGLRVWADGTWGHTGTVENARSMVVRRPDGLTWAITVNGNAPSNTDRLRSRIDAAFATIGVVPPATTLPPPPAPAPAPVPAPPQVLTTAAA
jgi:D-alanyl-D-alanine carboxypeptidase